MLVFPLTVLTVTRAKEKGTFLPKNVAWYSHVNCFYIKKCRSCSNAAGRELLFWLDRGSLLQIRAIMEKADALGQYFISVSFKSSI